MTPATRDSPHVTTADGPVDFAGLYREHVGRVHALCLRMAGDPVEATELTQDVFVRAWERLDGFRGDSALGTWLHRLAVNVVLERVRADRRRLARVEPASHLLEEWAVPSARDPVLERIDLDAALPHLPEGARVVFVLHDVEGFSHDEIARLTGLAPGTIRTQLHRARRHLSRLLSA
ncbi:MAG: RNA polymerase sigma factor [Gemmatirosa sp.]